MHTKLRSTKIIFIDRRALIYRESFIILSYNFMQSAMQTKKWQVMKEKLIHLVEEYRRINSKPK